LDHISKTVFARSSLVEGKEVLYMEQSGAGLEWSILLHKSSLCCLSGLLNTDIISSQFTEEQDDLKTLKH
jgi:hypothetical protein